MRFLFLLPVCLLCALPPLGATVYHVATSGDDAAPGTADAPWRTLQHAAATLVPGDTVLIRGGIYPITTDIKPARSGTADAWIQYVGVPGESIVIECQDLYVDSSTGQRDQGCFQIERRSYIRVVNLALRNSHKCGFIIRGYPRSNDPPDTMSETHHIELIGCRTDNTFSSGIGAWFSDHIRIVGCTVARANNPALRQPTPTTTPGPNEALDMARCRHFEVSHCEVFDCYKEGIDVKGPSRDGWVHHNTVHGCARQGLYVDARQGPYDPIPGLTRTEFITLSDNVSYDNEWGLALAAEELTGYMYEIQVVGNLLWRNRGSGLFLATWSQQGPIDQVLIAHNTCVANGRAGHWVGVTGGIDLRSANCTNITVINNLCAANHNFDLGSFINPDSQSQLFTTQNIVISHNAGYPATTVHYSGAYGALHRYPGSAAVVVDPLLFDAPAACFLLQPTSPALASTASPVAPLPHLFEPYAAPAARGAFGTFGAQPLPTLQLDGLRDVGFVTTWAVPHGRPGHLQHSDDLRSWISLPADDAAIVAGRAHIVSISPGRSAAFVRWITTTAITLH